MNEKRTRGFTFRSESGEVIEPHRKPEAPKKPVVGFKWQPASEERSEQGPSDEPPNEA